MCGGLAPPQYEPDLSGRKAAGEAQDNGFALRGRQRRHPLREKAVRFVAQHQLGRVGRHLSSRPEAETALGRLAAPSSVDGEVARDAEEPCPWAAVPWPVLRQVSVRSLKGFGGQIGSRLVGCTPTTQVAIDRQPVLRIHLIEGDRVCSRDCALRAVGLNGCDCW
jgi:hypothetical protein